MNIFKGRLVNDHYSIAIVVSRFNEFITEKLLHGALEELNRLGIEENKITVTWVPGCFEIPLSAKNLAETKHYHAIICLGAVIRGSTYHFELVANQAAAGIAKVSHEANLPVIFGVITTDTIEQAIERAGSKSGNKGAEAASCAIEMVNVLRQINGKTTKN